MDFEVILNEAQQLRQKLIGLKDQIDCLLGIDYTAPICNQIDLAIDGIQLGNETADGTELTLDALLKTAGDNQPEKVLCQQCCQRLALGDSITLKLPSLKSVVQNGKNYHAVCVNLWLLRSSSQKNQMELL